MNEGEMDEPLGDLKDTPTERSLNQALNNLSHPEQPSRNFLKNFHPGWFAAVMGTGIIAIASITNPGNNSSLASSTRTFAQIMAIIAISVGIIIIIPYIIRIFIYPSRSLSDLKDPAIGPMYGTLPGGILVLAAVFAAVGPTWFSPITVRDLVIGLDWAGIPLAFLISVIFAIVLFYSKDTPPTDINGGWFIPPVVTIVVPMVLAPLIPASAPETARALLMISYAFWGMGFLLYILILTILHDRLVLHPLPPARLAPTFWIGLGPIGVGSLALIKLAAAGTLLFGPVAPIVKLISNIAATSIWGLGVWWLAASIILLGFYLKSGMLPYAISWWGFTFPLGAYTVATLVLATTWKLPALSWAGAALFILLLAFWLTVTARSVWALVTREV